MIEKIKITIIKRALLVCILLAICSCRNPNGEIFQFAPDPLRGFNFPYLLFLPNQTDAKKNLTLIVEPNNTDMVSDDYEKHIEGAKQIINNFGHIGKYLSDSLKYPLLIPIFPRSEKEWKIYTHALDRDAIEIKSGAIKRIDLQLIAMIDDAKEQLFKMGYTIDDKVILTGFSASGTFVNRFTFLHPQKVKLCAAGGLNSLLILPINEINGTQLKYPLGTNDLQEITNDSVNLKALKAIPQFFFMGSEDDNDAVLYDDAFDDIEREIIYKNFGEDMKKRWFFCGNMYQAKFERVAIMTYKGLDHTISNDIRKDILQFTKKWLYVSGHYRSDKAQP